MNDETKASLAAMTLVATPTEEFIESIKILTGVEYEERLRGTPLHNKAVEMLKEARKAWLEKWAGKQCPCCGQMVRRFN